MSFVWEVKARLADILGREGASEYMIFPEEEMSQWDTDYSNIWRHMQWLYGVDDPDKLAQLLRQSDWLFGPYAYSIYQVMRIRRKDAEARARL